MIDQFRLADWTPETKRLGDGGIVFANWQAIRPAIEAAYAAQGLEMPKTIPSEVWNMAGLAIEAYRHLSRSSCIECGTKLWHHDTIHCLDCKAPLCERCAPKHFWPNGRRPDRPHR